MEYTVAWAETADQWGTDPALRFQHAHDFLYLLWVTRYPAWFTTPDVEALRAAAAAWPNERREKLEKTLQYQANRQLIRDAWETWLVPTEAHPCGWCGRMTTLGVRLPGARQCVTAGGKSFQDWPALRGPAKAPLCPACVAGMWLTRPGLYWYPPDRQLSLGLLNYWKIAITQQTATHVTIVLLNRVPYDDQDLPWWTWPWGAPAALWTHAGLGGPPTKWEQRHWLWQALPSVDPAITMIWIDGTTYAVPTSAIREAARQAQTMAAEIPPAPSSGRSSKRRITYRRRSVDEIAALGFPPTHPVARLLTLPPVVAG